MREIRQSGSEGGEPQLNAAFLPLSRWTAHGMCLLLWLLLAVFSLLTIGTRVHRHRFLVNIA